VRNDRTRNWYQYDDSSVNQVAESKIHSLNAYILFYKRKDLASKPLDKIYRSISFKTVDEWF